MEQLDLVKSDSGVLPGMTRDVHVISYSSRQDMNSDIPTPGALQIVISKREQWHPFAAHQ